MDCFSTLMDKVLSNFNTHIHTPSVSYMALNSPVHQYSNLSFATNTLLSVVYSVLEYRHSIYQEMSQSLKLQEVTFLDYNLLGTNNCKLTFLVIKDQQHDM